MIVVVTRLHVRWWRSLPPFVVHVWRIRRQAQLSAGFLGGALAGELPFGFWTFTVWTDEPAMRAFQKAAPHVNTMSRLPHWCDEASYVHWQQDDASLPPPAAALVRMRDGGKLSRVDHPSAAHAAGNTTAGVEAKLAGLAMRPRRI
jgi:hypothetical protein